MENAVAIVGMSCRFAGCPSVTAFWDAVMQRRRLLTAPGVDAELPFGQRGIFNRPYPARIGQLGNLYSCVASMQHFPREINAGENQDLYFATQLAFDALADASLKPFPRAAVRGSVRLGYAPPFNSSTVNWLQHTAFLDQTMDIVRRFFPNCTGEMLDGIRIRLQNSLPAPNAAGFLMGTGYRFASWIARECGLSGAATIMDAGMLTGAATIMSAMDDLNSGRADIALVGALTPPMSRALIEGLAGVVPFLQTDELNPFSADSDGTLPGEGGAFFVLKRREDALEGKDRIYAQIRSVALGHAAEDNPASVFAEAVDRASIPATTIGLVEADGNGIKSAEDREIALVQRLWGEHRPGAPLVGIGSVKGNIGHTLRASMAAGLVKAALAIWKKVLPPQVEVSKPSAALVNPSSGAYLLTQARPWITGDSANPRRAAVLGANFDAVDPIGITWTAGRSAVIVLEEEPDLEDRA